MVKIINPPPSIDRLKEVLSYDPSTGVFTWKKTLSNRSICGSVAGSRFRGYIMIMVDNIRYPAHRLAWLYVTGEWPDGEIDHKNTIGDDNRFDNLRVATRTQNLRNTNTPSHNTSGFKGVSWHKAKNRWRATIKVNRMSKHLGNFDTKEDAADAYRSAAEKLFGDFARWGH